MMGRQYGDDRSGEEGDCGESREEKDVLIVRV
jgi:hypothetical protein